jgi:lipopolysaccharide transport system permease protein
VGWHAGALVLAKDITGQRLPLRSMSSNPSELPVVEFTGALPLLPNFREAWRYRRMAVALARRNLMTRYTQTFLGPAWFILQPVILAGVLSLVMGVILQLSSDGMPYVVFAASGTILWTTFNRSLVEVSTSLVTMGPIFSKVYFPRILVPVAALITSAVEFLPVYGLLFLLIWFYGLFSGWLMLLFPLFVMLTLLLCFGAGLWLTVFDSYYRDVRLMLPFVLQFVFYFSPIIYPSSAVSERWRLLFQLNPVSGLVDGFRWSLIAGARVPALFEMAWVLVLALVLAASGLVIFARFERIVVDRI